MHHGPDFIVIGAMKAGTSTLHAQLGRQPGIAMSDPKEPNFFSDDENFYRGLEWYRSLFGAAEGGLYGESSTHYTKLPTHPNTVERMQACFPEVKLIYLIRDPIDRLVSHYVHAWSEGWVGGSIEEAIDRYPPLVQYGRYAMQIRPYLKAYGPERIKLAFFEGMVRDPPSFLRDICDFLGYEGSVKWHEDATRQNISSERLRRSPWRDAVVHAPGMRQIRSRFVPRTVREWVKGFWRMKDRPKLSPRLTSRLRSVFDEDLHDLGEWGGISLSCGEFSSIENGVFTWGTGTPRPPQESTT